MNNDKFLEDDFDFDMNGRLVAVEQREKRAAPPPISYDVFPEHKTEKPPQQKKRREVSKNDRRFSVFLIVVMVILGVIIAVEGYMIVMQNLV